MNDNDNTESNAEVDSNAPLAEDNLLPCKCCGRMPAEMIWVDMFDVHCCNTACPKYPPNIEGYNITNSSREIARRQWNRWNSRENLS